MQKSISVLSFIVIFVMALLVLVICFWFVFIAQPKPTGITYRTPEEMVNEANIDDRASFDRKLLDTTIDDSKGQRRLSSTFSCETKSEELTECVWQSKLTAAKVIIAFPHNLGTSPNNGKFNTVIILDKHDNILLTTIESAYNRNDF